MKSFLLLLHLPNYLLELIKLSALFLLLFLCSFVLTAEQFAQFSRYYFCLNEHIR